MTKKGLKTLGIIATVGGAAVALHGTTSKKWETAHTVSPLFPFW
ncbi:MAG TPA: hypothetical protein VME46_02415 [Acidimicrobiales bacterium]|nr:hypothetical protein [Acidimicrobiales bacterium]